MVAFLVGGFGCVFWLVTCGGFGVGLLGCVVVVDCGVLIAVVLGLGCGVVVFGCFLGLVAFCCVVWGNMEFWVLVVLRVLQVGFVGLVVGVDLAGFWI